MSDSVQEAIQAIKRAKKEIQAGNRRNARRFAQLAASLDPQNEEPWLILAALSTPKSSIRHLNRALKINPQSLRARNGLAWAIGKLRDRSSDSPHNSYPLVCKPVSPAEYIQTKGYVGSLIFIAFLLLSGFVLWYQVPYVTTVFKHEDLLPVIQAQVNKETRTPTPTFTYTPTPTFTPTSTLTATPTATSTSTQAPSKTPKPTPKPTKKPNSNKVTKVKVQVAKRPKGVSQNENWIDVDLSSQTAHALTGDSQMKSFVVSTGTWLHPTVVGTFRIYVKYRYANMSGPGYFLPNVPYVMYFYKDYGLHGTYWHHNFGVPMSHGCINFKTPDAAWLFNFASLGTIVNVHQ
jgi:lipoprotein-anchoring transpeptidase ErfK/SrfK